MSSPGFPFWASQFRPVYIHAGPDDGEAGLGELPGPARGILPARQSRRMGFLRGDGPFARGGVPAGEREQPGVAEAEAGEVLHQRIW